MAFSEKTALEQDWILRREKAVTWLRLGFAAVAIAVIQLNPARVARFPSLSIFALWSFFLYSVVALYFSAKNWRRASRIGAITTSLDVVWIALIVYSTGGTRTPFFFYYTFPVITAGLRWGLRGSVPVAFIGVVAYAIMRLTLTAESGGAPIEIDTLVVRSFYLILLGCVLATPVNSRRNRIKNYSLSRKPLGKWPPYRSGAGLCTSSTTGFFSHWRH